MFYAKCNICLSEKNKVKYYSDRGSICQRCVTFLKKNYEPPIALLDKYKIKNNNKGFNVAEEKIIRAYNLGYISGDGIKIDRIDNYQIEWVNIKNEIRNDDRNTCLICQTPDKNATFHVHHIIPLENFGTNNKVNLVTLCYPCHNKQHDGKVTPPDKPTPRKRYDIDNFIAVDIETTGLSNNDSIIEIAAVKFTNGVPVDKISFLIKPPNQVSDKITSLTGITNSMLASAKHSYAVMPDFFNFIGCSKLVFHNAPFDRRFIEKQARVLGYLFNNAYEDTLKLARKKHPEIDNHKLYTLVKYFKIPVYNFHRALDDAYATGYIYIKCLNKSVAQTQKTDHPSLKTNNPKIIKRSKTENNRETQSTNKVNKDYTPKILNTKNNTKTIESSKTENNRKTQSGNISLPPVKNNKKIIYRWIISVVAFTVWIIFISKMNKDNLITNSHRNNSYDITGFPQKQDKPNETTKKKQDILETKLLLKSLDDDIRKIYDIYEQKSEPSFKAFKRDIEKNSSIESIVKPTTDFTKKTAKASDKKIKQTVLETQLLLKKLGYKPGRVDGIYGQKTKTALKAFNRDFQKNINLTVNKNTVSILEVSLKKHQAMKNSKENNLKHIYSVNGITFIKITPGCFNMGSNNGGPIERPVHRVCLTHNFYISKYEITQKQWKQLLGNNPSLNKACGGDCPVEMVSWQDTQKFIKKLNNNTGHKYRLPTEAEWEYSCTGGKQQKYCGSDTYEIVGWFLNNGNKVISRVGKKIPNSFGLYDMSGNVSEWVSDRYDKNYYQNSPKNNPKGSLKGRNRLARGGSWHDSGAEFHSTTRGILSGRGANIGFRLVREL